MDPSQPAPAPPAWLARLRLPDSAAAWELYDAPGAQAAAADLTSALREAAALLDQAVRRLNERLRAHRDLGALDTEPRLVARQLLAQMMGQAMGACL